MEAKIGTFTLITAIFVSLQLSEQIATTFIDNPSNNNNSII